MVYTLYFASLTTVLKKGLEPAIGHLIGHLAPDPGLNAD